MSPIPEEFYEADANLYPDKPQLDISAMEQISDYINARLVILDQIFTEEN